MSDSPQSGDRPYNPQPQRPAWGVRVPARKDRSRSRSIGICPLPDEVVIPLDCGPTGIAEARVGVGDRVLTGQLIGVSRDGGHVHASLSGELIAAEQRAVPGRPGTLSPCLVIRSDGRDEWHPDCGRPLDAGAVGPSGLREKIAAAGIVGLGGALFPTADKLAAGQRVRALILNGAECEPYISCDEVLMRDEPQRVIDGARIMMAVLDTPRAVIVVETDMAEAEAALRDTLRGHGSEDVDVAVVTAKYPAGGERQLVELLADREVPATGLPSDVGYLCQNVATAAAVADLVQRGRPLISRIVTVTGEGVAEPQNLDARIGTPVGALIDAAGGYTGDDCSLIMGGPMMGQPLPGDGLPITKATNCIIVTSPGELASGETIYPCIRCGECNRVCPARLMPQELLFASRADDTATLAELRLEACIECGCCDYVCPSHINLTPVFARTKRRLRQRLGEQARAERARERSEARLARLRQRDSAVGTYQEAELTSEDLAELMARVRARDNEPGDGD